METKRWRWLLLAAALFALAIFLMLRGDGKEDAPPEPKVNIPRTFTSAEWERENRRKILPVLDAGHLETPQRQRDPVLAVLSSAKGKSAVVIEANALRNSPIGQLLIDCLTHGKRENPFEEMKRKYNIDLLDNLDRVAFTEGGLVLSGNFHGAGWDQMLGKGMVASSHYGDQGTVYSMQQRDGGTGEMAAAWGDQLLYFGSKDADARGAIDRIEGRAPSQSPLDDNQTYGDIYGVLSVTDLAQMLGAGQTDLADKLRKVASQVEIHVDASHDVGLSAELQSSGNADDVSDLAKSLGGLLSLARLQAKANGEDDVAGLLEQANVHPRGKHVSLEAALPLALLEKDLAWCRDPDAGTPGEEVQGSPSPAK